MSLCLDIVHPEDRPVVRNVILAMQTVGEGKAFASWTLSTQSDGKYYVLTAFLHEHTDCMVSLKELDDLQNVNPCRVVNVLSGRSGGKPAVSVVISHRDQPIMVEETQIHQIRKRRRWFSG